jgi:hypothetical protein
MVSVDEFLKQYIADHAKDEKWLSDKIQQKKDSVGGLLSDEGAKCLIAGERGWQTDVASEEYYVEGRYMTALDQDLLKVYLNGKAESGKSRGRIETLITKVISVGDAKETASQYSTSTTGVKVTDGKIQTWINFHDKPAFTSRKDTAIPGNYLSKEIQMIRSGIIGRTIELRNVDVWETQAGTLNLSTNNFTKLKVMKDLNEGVNPPSNKPIYITGIGDTNHPNIDGAAVQRALDSIDNDNHTMIYNYIFSNKGVSIDELARTFTDLDRLDIELIVKDIIDSGEAYTTNDGLIKAM